jgi:DNA-binding NtrC family response regulator
MAATRQQEVGPGHILVVDDDRWLCDSISQVLSAEGHRVETALTAAAAFEQLEAVTAEVVILDLGLPDMDGLDVLSRITGLDDRPTVIVQTGRDDTETIVGAMRRGADSFLVKPVDIPTLTASVALALRQHRMTRHANLMNEALVAQLPGERELVGSSGAMQRARELIARVAPTDSSVVLAGESGSGKGMAARLIHRLSQRAHGPFVDMSCAALPANLVESEMFGHERGAFTDAKVRKLGLLEVAHTGTLFLDEIGELELPSQGKLLKAIEERSFRRVGGVREVDVDVRFVVATHMDLKQAVDGGRFRRDLYYRLNVFAIEMPPLRERGDDVLELAYHFIGELNPRVVRRVQRIADPAAALLRAYPWPGNVRELRNVIERALILASGDTLTAAHLPEDLRHLSKGEVTQPAATLEEVEGAHIQRTLKACKGNVKLTATTLGISRSTLYAWMQRLGIEGGSERPGEPDSGKRRPPLTQ